MKTRDIHKRIENILLMGCDIYGEACYEGRELTEAEKRNNSDAMVVLSLDKDSDRIKMASLMRDVWVNIPGYGMEKLNAAFRLGGPELAMQVETYHAPAEGTYVVKRDGPWRMETDLIRATVYLWAFLLS